MLHQAWAILLLMLLLISSTCTAQCGNDCEDFYCNGQKQYGVIILGQSNGGALGDINDLVYPYTVSNICANFAWNGNAQLNQLSPAIVSPSGNFHGVELSLAYSLQKRFKNISILRHSVGGSGLYQNNTVDDWNVNSTGELFDEFKSRWNKFKTNVGCNQLEILAIYWIQGEKDATNLTWANVYRQNLIDLQNAVYTEIGQAPTWINVRLNIAVGDPPQSKPAAAIDSVRIVQMEIGDYWIDVDDIPLNNTDNQGVHYSSSGYIQIGNRLSNKTY